MVGTRIACLALAALLLCAGTEQSRAQTVGYGEALAQLAANCGDDIANFCSKINLGGGQVAECLEQHWAKVSILCKGTNAAVATLIKKRARARADVPKLCELDRLKFCGGIEPGDGRLLDCFYKAKQSLDPACQQAILDAGYEDSLNTDPASDQIHLSSGDIVSSLKEVERPASIISAAKLRQLAAQAVHERSRADRPPLFAGLDKLAQLTVAIRFDSDSARIRPSSYSALGLIADALYHPYLQGYCFLVVGHTDARGSREYNLKLSQERADAVREALINPFGISAARIQAVGLGEEQSLNRKNPRAPENRRVQVINIGKLGSNAQCPE